MRSSVVSPFVAASLSGHVSADARPRTFEERFASPSQGDCVSISGVRATSATIRLTRAILIRRAFWMAIRPINHHSARPQQALLAKDLQGTAVLALPTMRASCAVPSTDCLEDILDQVGRGETGSLVKAPDIVASLSACGGR